MNLIEFETECLKFVKFLNSLEHFLNWLGGIVDNIRILAQNCEFVFIFTPRKENTAAHADTHYALSINNL